MRFHSGTGGVIGGVIGSAAGGEFALALSSVNPARSTASVELEADRLDLWPRTAGRRFKGGLASRRVGEVSLAGRVRVRLCRRSTLSTSS